MGCPCECHRHGLAGSWGGGKALGHGEARGAWARPSHSHFPTANGGAGIIACIVLGLTPKKTPRTTWGAVAGKCYRGAQRESGAAPAPSLSPWQEPHGQDGAARPWEAALLWAQPCPAPCRDPVSVSCSSTGLRTWGGKGGMGSPQRPGQTPHGQCDHCWAEGSQVHLQHDRGFSHSWRRNLDGSIIRKSLKKMLEVLVAQYPLSDVWALPGVRAGGNQSWCRGS